MKDALLSLAQNVLSRIPPIRRISDARDSVVLERRALAAQLATREALAGEASIFYHYNACFDPRAVMRRHAASGLRPSAGYLTNFLGVLIDPKIAPSILGGRAGEVEDIPIPANWHSDIAEWGAALRAVDLASRSFTMIELGCGWGCWLNNAGVAARRQNLDVLLIGVEADLGHLAFARDTCEINGFLPGQVLLKHGVAAATNGSALFPKQDSPGESWSAQPVFAATPAQRSAALRSGNYDVVPMIPLQELTAPHALIDLVHIDIQGGEADVISGCLQTLCDKVAYLVIGTHSREIEGRLFSTLLEAGWSLEIERPAILSLHGGHPVVLVDGVQGWRNGRLMARIAEAAASGAGR